MVAIESHGEPNVQSVGVDQDWNYPNDEDLVRIHSHGMRCGRQCGSVDFRRLVTLILGAIVAATLAACSQVESIPGLETYQPVSDLGTEMRGDPNFSEVDLSDEASLWYRRLWNAIENPNADQDVASLARRGDLYQNGRALNEYITTLLLVFRHTGDLRLLDEVDRLAQLMRAELTTKWFTSEGEPYDPTDGTAGKLRWNYYGPNADGWYGKDEIELDSTLTHSTVSAFAFAFHNNRDLVSPAGVDYAERADFWRDYLQNHFEAIWRNRNDVPNGFPFLEKVTAHAYGNFARFHHYMGQITGDSSYLEHANEMVANIMADQVVCSTDVGPAIVWRHSVASAGGTATYFQMSTYVRYDVGSRVDLFMEGYDEFGANHMQGIANAMSQFMYDGDPENTGRPFAASLGGDRERCGLEFRDGFRTRVDSTRWATSSYGQVAAWDQTGLIDGINDEMYEEHSWDLNNPRSIAIPAAKVLTAILR